MKYTNPSEVLALYNKGLELYKKRQFNQALAWFQKTLEIAPGDGPSQLYIDRCRELSKNPPPEDWDGVFTMTSK
jgi:adenylate cyclase